MHRMTLRFAAIVMAAALAGCGERVAPAGAPHIDIGVTHSVRAGDSLLVPLTIDDARGTSAGPWAWTIAWGDGASASGTVAATGSPGSIPHVYAAPGSYVARALITDNGGITGADSASVTVGDEILFIGAGDIGECGLPHAASTAAILDTFPNAAVFTLGDNAYPSGSATDFANCYDPSWGRHKARTRPTAGNHEYNTPGASGYFGYFGAAAGDPAKGYYSYDLGDWHIVVLNSNISMSAGSAQALWLRADLLANPRKCTLAMWHHPLFTSGTTNGPSPGTAPLWDALYQAGADLVLVGHEHNYERFAPQTSSGVADPSQGIREFVAGMGGGGSYSSGVSAPNSEQRSAQHGLLKLTLRRSSYSWQFVNTTPLGFTDTGSASCH